MLDLVTMEPKLAGELTAAEKYIIKSRLRYVSISGGNLYKKKLPSDYD